MIACNRDVWELIVTTEMEIYNRDWKKKHDVLPTDAEWAF